MKQKPVLYLGTLAGLLLILLICRVVRPSDPAARYPYASHGKGGALLAEEADRLAKPKAPILAVLPDAGSYVTRVLDLQEEAFTETARALKRRVLIERISFDEGRMVAGYESGFRKGELEALLERHPDMGAVVSFLGPPSSPLPKKDPPIVCLGKRPYRWQGRLDAGLIDAAVVDVPQDPPPRGPDGRLTFEPNYQIMRP